MKLVTGQEVLERMNLASLAGNSSNTAIESAVEAATEQLSHFLRTDLTAHTRRDYFSLEKRNISRTTYNAVLRLSQRFLNEKMTVTIKRKPALSLTQNYQDFAEMETVLATSYLVDPRRGFVTLFPPIPLGNYVVAVEYSAGFKELDARLPSSLREAAIAFAIACNYQQTVTVGKKETKGNASSLFTTAQNIAAPLVIPNGGFEVHAVHTVIVK
jgi:hypothetical protein